MKSPKSTHTTIRNGNFFCMHCGDQHLIVFPISIPDMDKKSKQFQARHAKCEKTWSQPVLDQNHPLISRAIFWAKYGEHGVSSKTIFSYLLPGLFNFTEFTSHNYCHPHDPDDFRRCHLLFEQVPELLQSGYLDQLKKLSPVWRRMVDNWPKLTEMYLELEKTGKDNGMYQFVQGLINENLQPGVAL